LRLVALRAGARGTRVDLSARERLEDKACGIPHLKTERWGTRRHVTGIEPMRVVTLYCLEGDF
jgi:hypothetical protein